MPLYDYKCSNNNCETPIKEVFMNITSNGVQVCEKCGSIMIRQISKTNFKLIGDGWYKDGYSSKKSEKKNV